MKDNFIHVAFIIDESGSMSGSEKDIIGGFNKTIEEQKMVENGQCAVSFFSFSDTVNERFIGKDVSEVNELYESGLSARFSWFLNGLPTGDETSAIKDTSDKDPLYGYAPGGCTAMNDAIGSAIDKIGKWLCDMPEEERPSKNLIVIMTDGMENASKEYTLNKVKDMIQHQTEKYNWSFVYMGMDITTKEAADNLGISGRSFSSKASSSLYKNYSNISNSATCYRMSSALDASANMDAYLSSELAYDTATYEHEIGKKIK